MVLCDSNVWLALALSKHVHHATARDWLETVKEPASILLCRATQQTFLRLLTNASVLSPYGNPPLTNREAWSAHQTLLTDDRVTFRADELYARLPRPSCGWTPISQPLLWPADIRW